MANEQIKVPLYAASEILTAANMNISAGTGVPVFATTVTRDAAFGGAGEKVLAEGQVCYLSDSNIVQYYDGAAWATVGPITTTYAIFNETQANGTNGGTATSGSMQKRTLNTTVVNTISGCSIASSVITLPAGTYFVQASQPLYRTAQSVTRFRNTTDSTTPIDGMTMYMASANEMYGACLTVGYFTIAGSKNFELQYQVASTITNNGLGVTASLGFSEVYGQISITKVA